MAKKPTVTTIAAGYYSRTALNTNFEALRDAFDNTISIDGSAPNAMAADLDLGSNDLLNVGTINGASATGLSAGLSAVVAISADISTVAGISADVTTVAGDSADIATVAGIAGDVTTVAGISADVTTVAADAVDIGAVAAIAADVSTVATNVADVTNFSDVYYGASSSDPALRSDGSALVEGDLYFNTTVNTMKIWGGSSWANSFSDTSTVVGKTSSTGSGEMPSGTTAQRDVSPSAGYLRFNSTNVSFEGHNGSAWGAIGGGATGGGNDAIFYENGQSVTTSYTVTATTNAMTAGPITIDAGATVTVDAGGRWVVL